MEIVDVPFTERAGLERILEESFEGWYLRHSKGTLRSVEIVRVAVLSGAPVGLVMLKTLEADIGYVFYIAVDKAHRRMGVARSLLSDSLQRFKAADVEEVFAGIEVDNEASEGLFMGEGFVQTSFAEVSRKHGSLRALNMYRLMRIVPGEILLCKSIARGLV
jgi:ribosomal protein S18 acetylase RimI-like enzyme